MSGVELLAKLEEVTRERDSLLGQLAPRRAHEASVLAQLENQRKSAEEDIKRDEARAARDLEATAAAEGRRVELQRGLSPFGRYWARFGEPLVVCVLILSACVAMGVSLWSVDVGLVLAFSFGIGMAARWRVRRRRG